MRTINIGLDHIDRIYHIADVHVRNVKRHKEYEQVFKRLYTYIRRTRTKNSVIYLAGDIVHAKTDMSPELVFQVSELFRRLAALAPTILITGNHDCNLNNSSRLDALSPIVKALNHPNIFYLKDNGIYKISNVHFNVMSVFDKPSDYIRANEFDGDIKVALHHGAVNNASTDAGFMLSNTHVTTDLFDGYDLVLLGDIHKPQFLNNDKTIAYAGSLIQQNHGEALGHGIMVWDMNTLDCEFVEIQNDYGYYTYEIDGGKIVNPSDKVPLRPRLRLKVQNTDSADLKKIVSEIKQKHKVQEIAIQKINAINTTNLEQKINFGDVREVEWQNQTISDYLSNEHAVDDDTLDVVRHINRLVHSKLTDSELTRNVVWTPKTFEFSNMFSYGEDNVIDFENISGVNGLFAPNASGKSTLLDALAFCCFDKCSRTHKAVHVLNNKKSSFKCKFHFELDGKKYFVARSGVKNNKGHVKVNVDFWHEDDSGNVTMLNGEQRDGTNKIIRQYLGTYDDFVLTALSLQNNNTGFIDKSQRERKELLTQFLDIDVFEKQYQIAAEDIRETASIIKEYKRQDHATTLADAETEIQQLTAPLDKLQQERDDHESMRNDLNEIVLNLTSELKRIDDEISDINTLESTIKSLEIRTSHLQDEILHATDISKSQEKILAELNEKILKYNIKSIDLDINSLEELELNVMRLTQEKELLDVQIEHINKLVSKLDQHEWDPECEYCIANPWLQDTQTAAKKLPKIQEDCSKIVNEISALSKEIIYYKDLNSYAQRDEFNRITRLIEDTKKSLQLQKSSITSTKAQLDSTNIELHTKNQLLIRANERIDDIQFNVTKHKEIEEVRSEVLTLNNEISSLDDKILSMHGRLRVAEKTKQNTLSAIDRLRELEVQYKGYEYYLLAVKRDGVPYQLISKALPQIEAEINNILTQIVDFSVLLETDGKNINGYIVYDSDNYWPLELTSGMEKFISSLAIRTSLINITSLPRPNFLAIDEGFGVLDSDNLNSMYMLFDYLKSQFAFIMCISHIDAMRDVVDKLIEIKKTNGYSQINYA